MSELSTIIGTAFNKPTKDLSDKEKEAILAAIEQLDQGHLRVCEPRVCEKKDQKKENQWQVNEWAKQAILLYFRTQKMSPIQAGDLGFFDKIPLKKWSGQEGVRVVPHALARYGSHIESGAILMPSYINIGAYVGSGTLIDTWATVGSCAQVGQEVHISGGVGLGGVLEPLQASPVIIEDHAFIGSRCIIVEGVVVEQGAVLGAGVTITSSTKIIDVTQAQVQTYQGRVPRDSVVIPGSVPKKFPGGTYAVPAALIIGKRKASTNLKTSLNETLREYNISV